jgi:hypothetical protein
VRLSPTRSSRGIERAPNAPLLNKECNTSLVAQSISTCVSTGGVAWSSISSKTQVAAHHRATRPTSEVHDRHRERGADLLQHRNWIVCHPCSLLRQRSDAEGRRSNPHGPCFQCDS